MREYNPSKILYIGQNGVTLGSTNNLSAGLLGLPIASLETHTEAWRSIKNVIFVKSSSDIESCLGLESGCCAPYIIQ